MEKYRNRVQILNKDNLGTRDGDLNQQVGGPIVYWMNREIRTEDNWSLCFAQDLAKANNQQLIVLYNLIPGFLGGQNRQFTFKVNGLKVVEKKLSQKNIPFFILIDKDAVDVNKFGKTPRMILDFCVEHKAGALITDFYPLNLPLKWNEEILEQLQTTDYETSFENLKKLIFYEVDSHNIVPTRFVSEKQEYAAYTLRPKIHKNIQNFFIDFPSLTKQDKSVSKIKSPKIKWSEILKKENEEEPVWIKAGEDEARKMLDKFIEKNLGDYYFGRKNKKKKVQSDLSPYLHYGMISSHTIAKKVCDWVGESIYTILHDSIMRAKKGINDDKLTRLDHAGAFLEELIVRKELSDNFCLWNRNYDNPACFPVWATKSLFSHVQDEREFLYTLDEFEKSKTHDNLWNAAQMEMVQKGKMHGYMRMYWGKKILEWTENPAEAMRIAVYLNDKYELDGRDPNGYAGIAWSIGGVHDRPWFDRPIFGQIRYMNRSGCEKKFDVDKYINDNLNEKIFE